MQTKNQNQNNALPEQQNVQAQPTPAQTEISSLKGGAAPELGCSALFGGCLETFSDKVCRQNSEYLEKMSSTGKFLVDIPHNTIPSKRFEEGRPVGRTDERVGGTIPPNGDNCPC